jgi:hypothetical protein
MKNILLTLPLFLFSCSFEKPKIEVGDVILKCVVDSVWIEGPKSTLDFDVSFHYRTDCNTFLTTREGQYYHIGDTITYVKKKK